MSTFFNTPDPKIPPVIPTAPTGTTAPTESSAPGKTSIPTGASVPTEITMPSGINAPAEIPVPTEATTPQAPSIAVPPADDVLIRRFREAEASAVEKLNRDFHLSLSREDFLRIQHLVRETVGRDITVAELRLLAALDTTDRGDADREAVGELITDSPVIAETWADMMEKHAVTRRGLGTGKSDSVRPIPPCTYADALRLPERYLCLSGLADPDGARLSGSEPMAVLTAPWQKAVAVAAGYGPVARLVTHIAPAATESGAEGASASTLKCIDATDLFYDRASAGGITVVAQVAPACREVPPRAGDYLIHLPAASLTAVADLLRADRAGRHPTIADLCAVADRSYLDAILALAPGADIYTDRLLGREKHLSDIAISHDLQATVPTVTEGAAQDEVTRTARVDVTSETETAAGGAIAAAGEHADMAAATCPAKAATGTVGTANEGTAEPLANTAEADPSGGEERPPNTPETTKITTNASTQTPRATTNSPQAKMPQPRLEAVELVKKRFPCGATADFILRVPQKHLMRLTDRLRERKITTIAIGQVTAGEELRLYLHAGARDIPVAALPRAILEAAASVHLHRVEPSISSAGTWPDGVRLPPAERPLIARLPRVAASENGLSPQGHEVVSLTALAADRVTVRGLSVRPIEMTISVAETTVTEPGTGFEAAAATAELATRPLRMAGATPSDIRVAVSLTVGEELAAPAVGGVFPGTLTTEVLCGLYRALAENGIYPADPALQCLPAATPAVRLTVAAWRLAPANPSETDGDPRGEPVTSVAKDAPVILLPVLHRSWEGSLRAIADVLARGTAADCRLAPVAITTETVQAAASADTPSEECAEEHETAATEMAANEVVTNEGAATVADGLESRNTESTVSPPKADLPSSAVGADANDSANAAVGADAAVGETSSHTFIIPAAGAALAEQMETAMAVVLAMSAEDARLLMTDPVVRTAVERFIAGEKPLIAMGEAVIALAEAGLLPVCLQELTEIPLRPSVDGAGALGDNAVADVMRKAEPAVGQGAQADTEATTTDRALVPTTDTTARVCVAARAAYTFRDGTAIRLVRAPLLAPADPSTGEAVLATITLPDGRVVPDGLSSSSGRVIGLLNGLDPVLAERVLARRHPEAGAVDEPSDPPFEDPDRAPDRIPDALRPHDHENTAI